MSEKKNKYWMSLEQWRDEKTFQALAQKEFMNPPLAIGEGWERREFLKLMGASLALTSLGCLRRPAEKIVPYAKRPRDIVPGVSNDYASSYYDGAGEGFGLIVQTKEGRPVKVEGNKNHPFHQGGMSARAHSHLLALYDPDRLGSAKRNLFNKEKTNKETVTAYFDEADPHIVSFLKKGRTAILTDYFPSPFSWGLMEDFSKAYSSTHYAWDPLGLEDYAQSWSRCFNSKALVPYFHLDKARLVVSVNCDFLGTFLSPAAQTKSYSKARRPGADMNRLVVFESLMSLTGANADERFRILPSENILILLTLIDEVLALKRTHSDMRRFLSEKRKLFPSALKEEAAVRKTAGELFNLQGKSLVMAGGPAGQTEDYQTLLYLTHFLNDILGNRGAVIDEKRHYTAWSKKHLNIENLIQDLNQNQIQNVIIHRTNPVYSYPDKPRLLKALKKANLVISSSSSMDETAGCSDYVIPDLHDLEKWGVWEFQKDVYTIQQPTIRPLVKSRPFEENLIVWARMEKKGPARLRSAPSWHDYLKAGIERKNLSWGELLKNGFQVKAQTTQKKTYFQKSVLKNIQLKVQKKNLEFILYTSQGIKDGRLANVSWLQEFPDPVTKICWDNYLCLSPEDAVKKNLKEGQVVKVENSQQALSVPVHIQPGQAVNTAALALGYGRLGAGKIADHVGSNGYPLMKILNSNKVYSSLELNIQPTSKRVPLASVQQHHSMEGRQIVVETTLKRYLKNPADGIHKHKIFSLWSEHDYPREKWGMVIDLNSCTGCGACITACQSENNIPVVGKKYVLQGREMHWIRVDRYYKGSSSNPDSVVHQPVVCMHCDNAPCETVCPVAATVHSDEGTNDMIYNRCIGTRYCSNNCPYKVRRFNWFNYAKKMEAPINGALNPDVSVRSRGVMEKCTFCIHRIRGKQAEARLNNKKLKDGDIQTACQQSCPAGAIVFGDLNDKTSKVRQAFEKQNAYSLLEELNTKPAVRYRTRIKNHDRPLGKPSDPHHG